QTGSMPTPRPTVRERSRRVFVRLSTDVDATDGVGAEPGEQPAELAVDPDAVTQESAYQQWGPASGTVEGFPQYTGGYEAPPAPEHAVAYEPSAPESFEQPAESGFELPPQPFQEVAPAFEQTGEWGAYSQEPVYGIADASEPPAHSLDGQESTPDPYEPWQADAAPEQALAEPEPVAAQWTPEPEPVVAQWTPEPEPVVAQWEPEPQPQLEPPTPSEPSVEPFPEPTTFLGSTAQEASTDQVPAWAGAEAEAPALQAEASIEQVEPDGFALSAEEFPAAVPAWAPAPEQPAPEPLQPAAAEVEPPPVEAASPPGWSFARPPEAAAGTALTDTAGDVAPEQPSALTPEADVTAEAEPAPAAPPPTAPEPPAASEATWTPPAKDWSEGPSWGGSRSANPPRPATAPSLLEDPVAAVGLYIPGDVERFEGDMPLFGEADVVPPLWQGEGLGEPLFVDFNDLSQMLAGLRQLLPKGTRLTYNYDPERAWIRSVAAVDLAAYGESVRSLMWQDEQGTVPEADSPPG
ncbi:MAG: hypothetical protein ACXVZ1_02950, partial [Gaiellaceae bacterium]